MLKGQFPRLTPVQLALPGAGFITPLLGIRATLLYIPVDGSNIPGVAIRGFNASTIAGAWQCKTLEIPQAGGNPTRFKVSFTELMLQPKCESLVFSLAEAGVSLHDLLIEGAEAGAIGSNSPVVEGLRFSQQGSVLD
jgi:hypothetical protein